MKTKTTTAAKKAGIWLDFKNAYVFSIDGFNDPVMEKIESGVELRVRIEGESGEFSRSVNYISGEKEKKQRRQEQQKAKYFNELLARIQDADYVYVFGPGEAREGLRKAFKESTHVKGQLAACEISDKLTIKQMRHKVQEFFSGGKFILVKQLFETVKI